jgi:TetR/AcrR family transcriptional regulator, lmrAB and yxaGH operons repressor
MSAPPAGSTPAEAAGGGAMISAMPEASTRQRMIETAVHLFRRQGYHATSWRTLVETAGTPWGSAYHHFPGGKEQLGVAAIEMGSDLVVAQMERIFAETRSAAGAVRAWCRTSAERLADSDYTEGCPVATVALESTSDSEAITVASRKAFERWRGVIRDHLIGVGVRRKRAAELATLVLANVEGGLLLARVSRSKEPLFLAGEQLALLLTSEVRAAADAE